MKSLDDQARECDRIAQDLDLAVSRHSAWHRFEDLETVQLAQETAKQFRAQAKKLRVKDRRAKLEYAQKQLKDAEDA